MSTRFAGVFASILLVAWLHLAPAAQEDQTYNHLHLTQGESIASGSLCARTSFRAAYKDDAMEYATKSGSLRIQNQLEDGVPELIAGDLMAIAAPTAATAFLTPPIRI
ncbi:hypothetical protein [Vulcaniibacterium tengchongense]|uniref:hypothetical protein n=1 Tax=Vulcaniibacterium tengchongense TaxID=1273429 RepID=UPI000F4E23C4|nr:hypothetical protein [Vulcaniibacterium tengchongense]